MQAIDNGLQGIPLQPNPNSPLVIKARINHRFLATSNRPFGEFNKVPKVSKKEFFLKRILPFSKKPQISMSSLPKEVIGLIIDYLPFKQQSKIRRVNSSMLKITDNHTSFWKTVENHILAKGICPSLIEGMGSVRNIQSIPVVPCELLDGSGQHLAAFKKKGVSMMRTMDATGLIVIGLLLKVETSDQEILIKLKESKGGWKSECYPEVNVPRPFDYEWGIKGGKSTIMDKDCAYKIKELLAGRQVSGGLLLEDKFLNFSLIGTTSES